MGIIPARIYEMGYSTPKKQLNLKDFLAQPVTQKPFRNGMAFRRPGAAASGSMVAKPAPAACATRAEDTKRNPTE
ncbi:hypothetical protein [Rhodobacter lacus]|uniref:Uncharacterized protein n=1 Tax=Rhodobacter lacus TaxID=1641972 RepID=A0ABW5A8F1_9RHOB